MSHVDSRRSLQTRRLQAVLVFLIIWDVVAILAEVSFGGPLLKVSGHQIGGFLAARGSFSGIWFVPICAYVYALVRGPLRHPGVLWLGVVEQGAAALFAVYHFAAKDIELEGTVLPLVIAAVLLMLLLTTMPRGQTVV